MVMREVSMKVPVEVVERLLGLLFGTVADETKLPRGSVGPTHQLDIGDGALLGEVFSQPRIGEVRGQATDDQARHGGRLCCECVCVDEPLGIWRGDWGKVDAKELSRGRKARDVLGETRQKHEAAFHPNGGARFCDVGVCASISDRGAAAVGMKEWRRQGRLLCWPSVKDAGFAASEHPRVRVGSMLVVCPPLIHVWSTPPSFVHITSIGKEAAHSDAMNASIGADQSGLSDLSAASDLSMAEYLADDSPLLDRPAGAPHHTTIVGRLVATFFISPGSDYTRASRLEILTWSCRPHSGKTGRRI
ncbi:hypothetical protein L1887_43476 [Cichorium endivia]|nr:hypothetical protein L1887_43476 [Cichorium endivia]